MNHHPTAASHRPSLLARLSAYEGLALAALLALVYLLRPRRPALPAHEVLLPPDWTGGGPTTSHPAGGKPGSRQAEGTPPAAFVPLTGAEAPALAAGASPRWGSNIKMIVGLTVVTLILALVIYFRGIIGPLLLAFILSVLIQPLAAHFSSAAHISWRLSVNLIFLVLVLVLLGLITASGLAILQQGQVAITYINEFINTLPDTIAQMSHQSYSLGPFSFDFSRLDLAAVVQQGLDLVRPLLGEAGNLLGAIASGTVNTFGWGLFILLVSYFLLSESGRVQEDLVHIEIPGYTEDIRRLVRQLIGTWYAFLRGQATISLLIVVAYYILLTLLGTRLALVIALVAGIAAFIPYAGPAIAWTVTGIIAYLQVDNYFGLAPFFYAVLVVACCLVLNQIFDNLVWPRIMGSSLGLHPAGVLIAAIVATDLLGFVGLMLAAPVLATMAVLTRYVGRKMLDLDPWAPEPEKQRPAAPRWLSWWRRRSAVEGGSGERFRPSSG